MNDQIPLGDVLSVTTGCLVSRDHVGGVYRVCDHMTGVANFTHQLGRVGQEIAPAILAQHPNLASVVVPEWEDPSEAEVYAWLDQQEAIHGTTVDLVPLSDYHALDPIEELCDRVGSEKVYVFPVDGDPA